MTARIHAPSLTLLRAGLLAAVLALIAGILGMHVVTAGQTGHPAGHSAVVLSDPGHAATAESCGQACPEAHEAGTSCTPSAAGGSPVLPPAGATAKRLDPAVPSRLASAYPYVPSGPTPCELSISRT